MDIPLPADLITQGGAVGLLGITVVLILTGRLIPVSMYKRLEADRDTWRALALKASDHVDDLLPAAHTAANALDALRKATSFGDQVTEALSPPSGEKSS